MRFQVLLSLLSVTSWLCIDKIPEVAKTKVSKPKRYSLSMFLYNSLSKTLPRPPKTAHSNTPPHKYLLLTVQMQSFACRVCVSVRVCESKRWGHSTALCVCVCLRVLEEGDTVTSQPRLHHCVCHVTLFPSRAWTDGKTKDIINCLYFYFES